MIEIHKLKIVKNSLHKFDHILSQEATNTYPKQFQHLNYLGYCSVYKLSLNLTVLNGPQMPSKMNN